MPLSPLNAMPFTPPAPTQVGNQTQRTAVVQQSLNPVYNTHHEFFNIQTHDIIRIRVRWEWGGGVP
jgi:hypothetical protein